VAWKFRKKHYISYKSICGEALTVDRIAIGYWKKKLPNIIDKNEKRDILPNTTMAFKNETCSSGKVSKERSTVLLLCNMIGIGIIWII